MQGIGDGSRLTGAYMVKHVRSLVGKDLKRLGQVMHWALEQIDSSPDLQEAWKAQGERAAALYAPVLFRSKEHQWDVSVFQVSTHA